MRTPSTARPGRGRGVGGKAPGRGIYRFFTQIPTRWDDDDRYGHVNNAVHYRIMDTAVNGWLLERGLLDPAKGASIFLVVETACTYFAELAYPVRIDVGMRVERLGTSSVVWDIALFAEGVDSAAARGRFVHVLVDRKSRRPVPVAGDARAVFEGLVATK